MVISHKESSKTQTNSILNSYYKDTFKEYSDLVDYNNNIVDYRKRVSTSAIQIDLAIQNYFRAAKYLYMLEKRIADILGIQLDWRLNFANSYSEVIDYDINK